MPPLAYIFLLNWPYGMYHYFNGLAYFCLHRAAVDAVKRLDEALKQKKAYREAFHQDAVGLRYK